jgi:hypothetical protein
MRTGTRLALFALGLGLIFSAAVGIGSLAEPADTSSDTAPTESNHEGGSEEEMEGEGGHEEMSAAPPGLAVSEGGYSLRLHPAFYDMGRGRQLRFSITTGDGATVTAFDERHGRKMHLIIVRRDGAGFQHLHPEMDEAGTWTQAATFEDPGVYRVFTDFSANGDSRTLATDLFVSGGHFEAEPFPEVSSSDRTGDYVVRLDGGDATAGEAASLRFSVVRDGRPVEDLAPYLGAKGHLVALREGDLAFLHVHPKEATAGDRGHGADDHGHAAEDKRPGGEGGSPSNEIAFAATFPTPGRYRLYLQFRHDGAVQMAQFTVSVRR